MERHLPSPGTRSRVPLSSAALRDRAARMALVPLEVPGGSLLSDECIYHVRMGGQMPRPDGAFLGLVRGQYRRARRYLTHMDEEDFVSHGLRHYWRACLDYRPELRYTRGAVGFVGGRVVARLRNLFRTDRRRSFFHGEMPSDRETGEPLDIRDDVSVPVDVQALLGEVRRIAASVLGESERKIIDIMARAVEGDKQCVQELRNAMLAGDNDLDNDLNPSLTKEAPVADKNAKTATPAKLKHVRPHGALVGTGKLINAASVLAGLAMLGLEEEYAKRAGHAEVKTGDDVTLAVRVIDERVDRYVGETGKGFECIIQEAGKKGCGSVVPGEDLCPERCPYCGESFEDDGSAAEPAPKPEPAKAKGGKAEKPAPAPKPAKAEKPAPAPKAEKPAPAPKAKAEKPAPAPKAADANKGGRPKMGASHVGKFAEAVAASGGKLSVTERAAYHALFCGPNKVATGFIGTSRICFIIPTAAYEALPKATRDAVKFYDKEARAAKHLGRDSVEYKGTDGAVVDALIAVAVESAGKPLDVAAK